MNQTRIFISFSSLDRDVVREFFYALKSQNLEVWNYSIKGEEIPPGKEISEYLKGQIDKTDYFISFLSCNSVSKETGRYPELELSYAISKGFLQRERIFPIMITDRKPEKLYNPFSELKGRLRFEINSDDKDLIDEITAQICRTIGCRYFPPLMSDYKIPFAERLETELKSLKDMPVSLYEELMTVVSKFIRQFKAKEKEASLSTINYFIALCSYKMPDSKIYYSYVLKGLCEIDLGDLQKGEETFGDLILREDRDENAFAGLGIIWFRQGKYEDALNAFKSSLSICKNEYKGDILFNILTVEIAAGIVPEDSISLNKIKIDELSDEDKIKVDTLRAVRMISDKNYSGALSVFERIIENGSFDLTAIIYYVSILDMTGNTIKAVRTLEKFAGKFSDALYYHYLGSYYYKIGEVNKAISIYESILCTPQNMKRQYTTEFARILFQTGNDRKGRDLCLDIIKNKPFGNPSSYEDFFYDGFVNYLIGRYERAKYDYERSGGFSPNYYDTL